MIAAVIYIAILHILMSWHLIKQLIWDLSPKKRQKTKDFEEAMEGLKEYFEDEPSE